MTSTEPKETSLSRQAARSNSTASVTVRYVNLRACVCRKHTNHLKQVRVSWGRVARNSRSRLIIAVQCYGVTERRIGTGIRWEVEERITWETWGKSNELQISWLTAAVQNSFRCANFWSGYLQCSACAHIEYDHLWYQYFVNSQNKPIISEVNSLVFSAFSSIF